MRHREHLRDISRPRLVDVRGCEPYESTYDVDIGQLAWLPPGRRAALARALLSVEPRASVFAFHDMLGRGLDSDCLYALFVLFRACAIELTGDATRALSTPVRTIARDPGFPLHADLFVRRRLLIVFDDVDRRGGASMFLSVRTLLKLLDDLPRCPARARTRIRALLEAPIESDSFDELYDLLHSPRHAWVEDLERQMADRQLVFSFARGQGYLIDDRRWLHGRLPSRIAVRSKRFRRLVF